jgi:hypothetical protein
MFIKFHDSDGHICPLNILVTRFCIRVLGDKIKQGNKNPLNIYIYMLSGFSFYLVSIYFL